MITSRMNRSAVILLLIVILGGTLRLVGLGWGIPRYDTALAKGTLLRISYHPDEDRMLWQLERMRPESLDFHPDDFGFWGTLQTYLVGLTLAGSQVAGAFETSWREGFRAAHPIDLPRVFMIGRLLSALFGVATLLVIYSLARGRSGLWAAALLAVSPLHVVNSHFLTTDVALTFWVSLALLLLTRSQHVAAGLTMGAALATKWSALVLLPLLALAHLGRREPGWWKTYLALLGAFLVGQPYVVLDFGTWREAVADLLRTNAASPGLLPIELLARQSFHLAYYGVGPAALGLALLWLWQQRREPSTRLLVAASGLWFASLCLVKHPLARYTLPLLPLLAVAAGSALTRFSRRQAFLWGLVAILPPLVLSGGQLRVLTEPHTARRAADWIVGSLRPGSRITQQWLEYPVLDGSRFALSRFQDPFGVEGRPARPLDADLVVVDDFPLIPFRPELLSDLAQHYRLATVFRQPPRLGRFAIPEPARPHDWKYTHPEISLYLRR